MDRLQVYCSYCLVIVVHSRFTNQAYLQEMLEEMNRRLRRRMVTRGDVSLDVEDNRGPYDWPQLQEITSDMLQFSVHLPLDPRQQSRWPGGDYTATTTSGGVVRVLNIVVEESRILSSRERCPFLIHVEVAETGLSGNDSRLYATGAPGLGATIGEALAMSARRTLLQSVASTPGSDTASYQIPSELLEPLAPTLSNCREVTTEPEIDNAIPSRSDFVRGGYQGNDTTFYSYSPEEILSSNAYDDLRQNEYEQLHQQMYVEQSVVQQQPSALR
jgi:hypothetical protein